MRPAGLVGPGSLPGAPDGAPVSLCIAGLTFAVTGDGVAVGPVADPAYREFQPAAALAGREAVGVRVSRRGASLPQAQDLIFDTADSWAMYADGDRRTVVQRVFAGRDPGVLGVTSFSRSGRDVDIRLPGPAPGAEAGAALIESPLQYPLDQVLAMYFLAGTGVVLHAAGAVRGARGYCFAGRSGAGKSTLARVLAESRGWELLSDDRVVVRRGGRLVALHGTPWPGEGRHASAGAATLGGLLFLRQGERPHLEPLAPRDAAARLFPVAGIPWFDAAALPEHLDFCDSLACATPAWEFTFPPDGSAAAYLERHLG